MANHNTSKAPYARVSQTQILMQVSSLPDQIWHLSQNLTLPEARDEETRLRILTIRGMFEVNYDGATAQYRASLIVVVIVLAGAGKMPGCARILEFSCNCREVTFVARRAGM